jgi:hypothetical protein
MTRYTTWGDVGGFGPVRRSLERAEADLRRDIKGCRAQGGYSDRAVYVVDAEGFLRHMDNNALVWPSHGRSHGAVRWSKKS